MLQAIPKDASGNTLTNRIATWSTSDPAVATVAAGVVTGVAFGTATITATVEGQVGSMDVKVKDGVIATAAGASYTGQNSVVAVTIPAGALIQTRNVTVAPADAPPPNDRLLPGTAFDFGPLGVTFAQLVSITIKYDPAKVTGGSPESGLQLYEVIGTSWRVVAGSTVNTTTKTVTGNVDHMAVYGVLMQPRVETVSINKDTTVVVQTTVQFTAALKDNEQQPLTRPVTWTSSNPAIVKIDANGLASALLPGQVTITATSEGKSTTAKMTAVPGPPAALSIAAGDGQAAEAGSVVPTAIAAKVSDAFGNGVSGFSVTFAIVSGGGTITGATATTDAGGIATIGSWTLGTVAGPNTVTASGAGLSPPFVTFTATGGAGAPTSVVAVGGNNQTATAGGPVATPPSVKVTDANGNPVTGFTVVFAPASGSGTVTGASVATNSSGIATVGGWVLGSTPGPQTLTATAGSLSGSPVTFAATGVAPIPARIVLNNGNLQTAGVGKPVPVVPSVKVVDAADIPVPGLAVTFTVTGGGGSVVGGDAVTNVGGFANVTSWILGPNPGTNTLTATVASLPTLSGNPVTFTASGVAAPPVAMAIAAGNQQSAPAGTQVAIKPAVLVTDANGAGVPGVTVVFSIRSGSGSITGANAVTNSSGIATIGSWTLGIAGNSLFATVDGLAGSPLIFVALGSAQVQVVTFGDSNTDFGFSGTDPNVVVASYVSNRADVRLGPNDANSPRQLAGKIETRWTANRPNQTIKIVNHGIAGTSTGAGRTVLYSPNARELVNGVARFQGEALGMAYPWSGDEPFAQQSYPTGPIQRVQAFTPRASDFLYISMGTNDFGAGISTASSLVNLEWMVDQWIALGLPANHVIITTLPPRQVGQSASLPGLNDGIRSLASRKGLRVVDIATLTSNDNGLTWKSASLHVGDSLHYAESVRDSIADAVTSIMLQLTP